MATIDSKNNVSLNLDFHMENDFYSFLNPNLNSKGYYVHLLRAENSMPLLPCFISSRHKNIVLGKRLLCQMDSSASTETLENWSSQKTQQLG